MGLTPKEYNEFIVYWAPLLQNNPYNLISFQAKNYEELAGDNSFFTVIKRNDIEEAEALPVVYDITDAKIKILVSAKTYDELQASNAKNQNATSNRPNKQSDARSTLKTAEDKGKTQTPPQQRAPESKAPAQRGKGTSR